MCRNNALLWKISKYHMLYVGVPADEQDGATAGQGDDGACVPREIL